MTAHARLAPSAAHRWMHCPGSVAASEGKEGSTSVYAAEGTVAHMVLERCLLSGANAVGFLGQVHEQEGFEIEVTQEMVDAVQSVIDYVRQVREASEPSHMWVERRDGLDRISDIPEGEVFGTTDVCIWAEQPGWLDIMDLKYGQGVVVEARDNEQLMIYALAQVLRIGSRPERIRLHIMQPRAHHEEGPIRVHELTFEELVEFKGRLVDAVKATRDPEAPLVPGDHCRFCPAAATCPAQRDLAIEVAQMEFADTDVSREAAQLPAPEDMEMERVLFALRHADTVRGWFSAVEQHALNLLSAGAEVPGYKLVRANAHRRWVDEDAAEKVLQRAGLKKKERTTTKVVSPAQAERALKKIDKELDPGLWEKPEGALRLAPEADARPAVLTAAEEFGALPDPESA